MAFNSDKWLISGCLHLLLLLLLPGNAASQHIVKTLPGFSGELPFKLETGYVSVGDVEFFYYFIESLGNPGADPLLLYLNGGPGCSGLNGFFFQTGPLAFNITDYTGGLPQLLNYPHSWTKTANIIYLDAYPGAGFSYATTTEAYNTSDTQLPTQLYGFIKNWIYDHPHFTMNPLFIATDSYAGLYAPMLAQEIINGNEAGLEPQLNLKGYIISCPHAHTTIESNSRIPFAHRMALISDTLYESAKSSCQGSYTDVDASNFKCVEDLEAISECTKQVSGQHILEPNCAFLFPELDEEVVRRSLQENTRNFLLPSLKFHDLFWCRNFVYLLSDIWGNYKSVQDALHVRPGTVRKFFRCNVTLSYSYTVSDGVPYQKNLTKTGLQNLVFSGDHDMVMPHIGIEEWIKLLEVPIDSDWRPWFIEGQVAGYTVKYVNDGYRLTYATIKGAGHSPHEYERKACYEMFHRWIHYYPL